MSRFQSEISTELKFEIPEDDNPSNWEHLHQDQQFLLYYRPSTRAWAWECLVRMTVSPWHPDMLTLGEHLHHYDRLAQRGRILRIHGLLDNQPTWASRFTRGVNYRQSDLGTYVMLAGSRIITVIALGQVSER